MFKNTPAFSSFSVDDLEKAKQFYSQVLQLEVTEDKVMGLLHLHLAESTSVLIYPKPNHEPATFTILNFRVNNIDEAVRELKSRNVIFENYQNPAYGTDENHISRNPQVDVAWFKDPASNILSVLQEKQA
ncbi:VOC family protein [Adhaeribacter swui]|uniref:VOC family protein n=2 Tax=Adhaeribacter swui TaxID=2086471 RepID=A0A7G7GFB9_9BACT|nr:VOC family protein [Adhaeribacter swui]